MEQDLPHFPRPPVCEAIIDIRIQPLSPEALPILEKLHTQFSQQFPKKQTRYEIISSFKFEEQNLSTEIKSPNPLGYIFGSADDKKLVQFRRDGFTFNQLKPDPDESWPGWNCIKSEAKKYWDQYFRTIALERIERLTLRYINKINLDILPDTIPHPRHANIVIWPDSPEARNMLGILLSQQATLIIRNSN